MVCLIRKIIVAMFLIMELFHLQESAATPKEIYKNNHKSIVTIVATLKTGTILSSGVLIKRDEIITNCHAVLEANEIKVSYGGNSYFSQLTSGDRRVDLCILRVVGLNGIPAKIDSRQLEIGERVYAIGNPEGLEKTLSEGMVSSLRTLSDGIHLIQITTPISFGSSGGGLFDERGSLVGITTMGLPRGSLNFAMPVAYINSLPKIGRSFGSDRQHEKIFKEIENSVKILLAGFDGKHPIFTSKFLYSDSEKGVYTKFFESTVNKLKYFSTDEAKRREFVNLIWYEARRAGLEPALALAVIDKVSGFNQYFISPSGRRGYLVVPPEILDSLSSGLDPIILFDPAINLRIGCSIIRALLDKHSGDMYLALKNYDDDFSGEFAHSILVRLQFYR